MKRHYLIAVVIGLLPLLFAGGAAAQGPSIGGCSVFPADDVGNTPVDALPVDPSSGTYVATIGSDLGLKADFGSGLWDGGPIGIPFSTVASGQPKLPIAFGSEAADESDPGPYPVPLTAPIEGGSASTGDRHVLTLDTSTCILYELYDAFPQTSSWTAYSGAVFNLHSNALRPATWTSGDAAGLPILPGLVRYDEVAAGEIDHAIRFTVPQTRNAYIWPARHQASKLTGTQYPPMGQRFRLKASYDISGFSAANQVILKALKKYGMIIADNGSSWYMSGVPDERWDNDDLHKLGTIPGSQFEAVNESPFIIDANSGQARADADGDGYTDAQETTLGRDPKVFCPAMRADIDGDGKVSVLDVATVAGQFLKSGSAINPRYDQDFDGSITILDLAAMASRFLQSVSACP